MEFFHLIKATQKSGKPDAIFWQSQKTDARASLALDVALEDAEIETGRGRDYLKPVRTDFPVFNDLPEESTIDFEWCKRYELGEDNRTWYPIIKSEPEVENKQADNLPAGVSDSSTEKAALLRPVSRLRLSQRLIAHLINDTEVKEITEEQHVQIGEMESDDNDRYIQNLLLAIPNVPGIKALSAHVEWNLVSALKLVFERDQEEHAVSSFGEFMNEWIENPESRTLTVHKWLYDELPETVKNEIEPSSGTPVLTTVVTLPLRQRILVQFIANEYAYHIDAEQKKTILALELDVDNSYVQNMLLAAENVEPFKKASEIDIFRVITALKSVFPIDGKRVELSLVIQFFNAWFNTEHIDRGLLVKEWCKGNRVSQIQRSDTGTNAGGGNKTDRNSDYAHTLDTLDIEIALATLPMDFNIYDIPGGVYRRAKEIVSKKESPFKEWSKALRGTPGILDYSRASVFALIRNAHPDHYQYPGRLSGYINANLTESNHEDPTEEILVAARHNPEVSWEKELSLSVDVNGGGINQTGNASTSDSTPPVLEKVGKGIFSIEGLATGIPPSQNVDAETTSNVQMEKTVSNETENSSPLSKGQTEIIPVEGVAETGDDTTPLNIDTGHQNNSAGITLFSHLMVDLETMGNKANAPIVSIGAVFFDPDTGTAGAEFYKIISLESAMSSGGIPDASTIIWWLKKSPEARAEIVADDAIPLDDALLQFNEFIAENAANGSASVQVWGNGASFDNVILKSSYDRTGIHCPWVHWNDRDVRTIVELGKAVGFTPRYEIPFEGEAHKAIADAHHQVKYVSAIWQRLTKTDY
ncbi:3'-5' exoribonuclease [Enterobacter sp. RHBSTW-00994]|uniref:exonuclease n=1 Tax=Enterobacter sp. RHBSTW-00994 TaxID=2742676 RepID=UPI0015E90022|nr:exonuclease [Enterobacter sp. RHBSTW-00994]QLR43718.1 3'-5' exoribonuclease [Enterobacter sp. RHBSTW-00994]